MKVSILYQFAAAMILPKGLIHFASADNIDYSNITPEIIKKYAGNVTMDEFQIFSPEDAVIWEQFTEESFKKWIPSKATIKNEDGSEVLKYTGSWSLEEPTIYKNTEDDLGLTLKTPAAHHAISRKFDRVFNPKGKPLIIQFEVKMQTPITCAGAYMKLLRGPPENIEGEEQIEDDSIKDFEQFSDKAPYTIMFGPDICDDKKIHFIINAYNPITKKFEEKHMVDRPEPRFDQMSHLYTLMIDLDNSFKILVDNKVTRTGNLLTDFEPPINPPKEIDDSTDFKPEDWDDRKEIIDENAVKPDDWDENAPRYVEDAYAIKPKDWNESLPSMIPDPDVIKPEEWDDEMDGEWEPPTIRNPACKKISGCGPYKRPMIANPNYKGKWEKPMIKNPDYKGEWAAKKIPNPDYFETEFPCEFTPLSGIGFELWSMNSDIMFDNIYIGTSEGESVRLSNSIWVKKYEKETEIENSIKFYESDKLARKEFNTVPPAFDLRARSLYYYYQYIGKIIDLSDTYKQSGIVVALKKHPKVAAGTFILITYIAYLFNSIAIGILNFFVQPNAVSKKIPEPKDETTKKESTKKESTGKESTGKGGKDL
ncbi:hypothetical protein BB561_001355 [Smittium simulii]|uniref:Calnexin n=1 Tax=Smittium simulii TaxID=133385 RepID=A0A2T9YV23_9FUNG|nr:hypothetical protein BB561_001355 [Smittium simulii]